MRCFFAVELADAVLEEIERALRPLRQQVRARWVARDKQHVTLVFLGDLAPEQLPYIQEAGARTARGVLEFKLGVGAASGFPNPHHPRVLWLGLTGQLSELQTLKASLDKALIPHGVTPETRAFRPHLTLARSAREGGDARLATCIAALEGSSFGSSPITHLCLFESRQGADRYLLRGRYPLTPASERA
ncbi:MAG TPA: RNA 2',3'-cyclic phosphodiesterase [Polyangiaceae bacterium]|nr:RNA 2',3'-cyclic phosphodiesterase [Polyangiaceae bacterium]